MVLYQRWCRIEDSIRDVCQCRCNEDIIYANPIVLIMWPHIVWDFGSDSILGSTIDSPSEGVDARTTAGPRQELV